MKTNNTTKKVLHFNSSENQRIKGDFVEREVYCNVSQMAEYILQMSFEDSNAPFCYEELDLERFRYEGSYICFDYLTTSQKEDAVEELSDLIEKIADFEEDWQISAGDYTYIAEGVYKIEQLEEIKNELADIEALDGDNIEVYEWWAVSGWLAKKLEEKGEIILDTGTTSVWGRTTTGQAILLDYVISQVCEDLNLLK